MDKKQLTDLVIIPTLKEIPHGYSAEAVMAAQMIIAHESLRGKYIHQTNGGPAHGLIGMEPPTYFDTWKYGDSIWRNALILGIVRGDTGVKNIPSIDRLHYDLRFNIFMIRQKLFMADGALPDTKLGMAIYLKKHWNGEGEKGGKATAEKYLNDFQAWN